MICNYVSSIIRGGGESLFRGAGEIPQKNILMDKLLTLHEASVKC